MLVTPIEVEKIRASAISLRDLVDRAVAAMGEGSVLAITSKIVSLCEGRVLPIAGNDRDELIKQEADYYLPPQYSKYGHHFTVVKDTIVGSAGIDESNGDGNYVLWPKDAQATANAVRKQLQEKFGLSTVGVVITDSISTPLRLGAMSAALAHSGFEALRNYIGEPDLFGHPYSVSRANIAGGLAAAAGVAMGEGSESTPLCVLSDLPFVTFQDYDPTPEELRAITVSMRDDLFAPFLATAPWQRGEGGAGSPPA